MTSVVAGIVTWSCLVLQSDEVHKSVAKLQATYRGQLQRSGRGFLVKPFKGLRGGQKRHDMMEADTVQYLSQQVKPALVASVIRASIDRSTNPIQQIYSSV